MPPPYTRLDKNNAAVLLVDHLLPSGLTRRSCQP